MTQEHASPRTCECCRWWQNFDEGTPEEIFGHTMPRGGVTGSWGECTAVHKTGLLGKRWARLQPPPRDHSAVMITGYHAALITSFRFSCDLFQRST